MNTDIQHLIGVFLFVAGFTIITLTYRHLPFWIGFVMMGAGFVFFVGWS